MAVYFTILGLVVWLSLNVDRFAENGDPTTLIVILIFIIGLAVIITVTIWFIYPYNGREKRVFRLLQVPKSSETGDIPDHNDCSYV